MNLVQHDVIYTKTILNMATANISSQLHSVKITTILDEITINYKPSQQRQANNINPRWFIVKKLLKATDAMCPQATITL